MTGEFHFTEDPVPPDGERRPQAGSWSKVILVATGSCVVAAGVMWAIVPKGASEPPPAAAAPPAQSSAQPTHSAQAAKRERPDYHGPPKFTVQLGESKTEDCPALFTQSIVVRVYKGEADHITAVAKVPVDKVTRSRDLFEVDTEWSTMIGALPTKRTINLLVIATGPGGKTTVGQDISQPCAGEPMDKPDPTDLSTRAARQKIRDKMFDGGYDFKFDFDGKVKAPDPDSGDGSDDGTSGRR